jgi:peptidyl-dipeptidase A
MKPLSSQLGLPLLVLLVGVICVTSCGGPKKKPAAAAGRSMPKGRSAAKTPIPLKQRGRALSIPKDKSEESGRKFMQELEPLVNEKCAKSSGAVWNFVTNLSPANQELATNASLEYSEFRKVYWKTLVSFPWKSFKNKTLKRQFFLESTLSTDILSSEKIKELADLINKMKEIYSTAKVCDYKINTTCDLSLDPDITDKLAESRDYDELEYYWVEWREASGKKMPHYYKKYVDLVRSTTDTKRVS